MFVAGTSSVFSELLDIESATKKLKSILQWGWINEV